MQLVLEAVVLGVLTGGVYALMASGLTLIFWVLRIINVGQGALVNLGGAVRATMLNRTAAQLIGVDVDRVSALAFGVGMATAAAGGVVFGITNAFNPGSHYDLISRLLTIIVLGGLGSLRGAVIAALIMLITTEVAAVLISPVWASFVFFVILVAVLIVRPQGLYGVRVRERI